MIEPGTSTTSTAQPGVTDPVHPLTVGVEEEFLLVDARTLRVVPAAPLVLSTAAGLPQELHAEGTRYQVEISTPVADSAVILRRSSPRCGAPWRGRPAPTAAGCWPRPRRCSPWRARST